MSEWFNDVLLILALVFLNALFAGAEIALLSIRTGRMKDMAEKGSKAAQSVLRLTEQPERLLATIQIGITLAGFLASATAAVGISTTLAAWLERSSIPLIASSSKGIAVVVVTIAISYVTLVLGELVPKRLALQYADAISLRVARLLEWLAFITSPFVQLLTVSTRVVMWLLGEQGDLERDKVSEEEILDMVTHHEEIPLEEKTMIRNVFELGDTTAREIMIPRHDIVAVPKDLTLREAVELLSQVGLHRVPVYDTSLDNIVGQASLNTMVGVLIKGEGESIHVERIMESIRVIPEQKPLGDLLQEMKEERQHLVVVADEYGTMVGMVTLIDLIEELIASPEVVGDIATPLASGEYMVAGDITIREANRVLGLDIPESEDYITLAGFVLDQLGRVPSVGDSVTHEGAVFTIDSVIRHRVDKIRVALAKGDEEKE